MFVDELKIEAKAGAGGTGVVRWRHEKYRPMAGPSGGNGGRGGDMYVRAVKDLNKLATYTGRPFFEAEVGANGRDSSQHGRNGNDYFIEIPVGSRVTDIERGRVFEMTKIGEEVKILKGGSGGLGNEHFKSSTNQSPEEFTPGNPAEEGNFLIEVALMVDVGLIGLPNAGKSTTLNSLTNSKSKIGAYPFTTLEPHLGDFYGHIIADIPGLIEGAAAGKGLGHKFLRHVSRTKMLLHAVSLDSESPLNDYYTIRKELSDYDTSLSQKEEWILLTKKDLVEQAFVDEVISSLEITKNRVFVLSENDSESYKTLADTLAAHLEKA